MKDRDYTPALAFLADLFSEAEQAIELRACANERSGGAASLMTEDDAARVAFCQKHDRPEWGTYFGAATRIKGATSGDAASTAECVALWVDIDCAKQGLEGKLVLDTLAGLPFPPTHIVNSGGGLHGWWKLEEPIALEPAQKEQVSVALRRLAHILAGDLACAEIARIMRLPGTMNSKPATVAIYGEPFVCELIEESGRVYAFAEIAEWLETQRVLLVGKPAAKPLRPVLDEADPFVRYARAAGYEPSIDIDAALSNMEHESAGENSVHSTQLRVSASMLARGYPDDEILATILSATERAAPGGERWNWGREEKKIRDMVASGRRKGFAEKREERRVVVPLTNGNAALKIVPACEPEPEAESETHTKESKNEITVLGGATLVAWRERYGPIMHSQGTSYTYEAGVWSLWDQGHEQMLRALLQEGCAKLRMKPATSLLNAATRYVMDHPDLLVREIEFDKLSLIVAEDGVLNLDTLEIKAHSPDYHAKFRIGAKLDGASGCPAFLDFLAGSFADRPKAEAQAIIGTLQEWFGAALVANKPRSLRKGLLIHGGSRTGKTQVSEIMRALLGRGQTTAIKVRDLEKDFGTETLIGKRGWIADDAVGQGEVLDAETYKVLVTGEAMSVRRKNRGMIDGFRFACPVCLTMNNLPKIKDGSDAVYNRSLILPMTNVRPENAPEPEGYDSIAEKVIEEELTGVLWWAVEGWKRLRERGVYAPPACMTEAVQALKESNDDIGTWASQCAVSVSNSMVAPADLFASFAGWFFQEKGDTKFGWSQNGFSRVLKERLPRLVPHRDGKARWMKGIRLNDDGLEYWTVNDNRDVMRRTTAKSVDAFSVNQQIAPEDEPPKREPGTTIF